jgi:MarR family transcriptional regulator, organic hydroperoxide resistance regulator
MEIVSMYSIDMSEERMPTPGFLVWRLSMKWRVAVDRAVGPLGLTHAQYSVLASLFGMVRAGERPSQRRLADHTGLEPIYISKLVRALEAAGLVERSADPADTRAIRLTLTDAGFDVAGRAIAVVRELQEELTAPLGGTRGERTRTLVRELETLLAAPRPPGNTGEAQ